MRQIWLAVLSLLCAVPGLGQDKHWIFFTDKGGISKSFVGESRTAFDSIDLPISPAYEQSLTQLGIVPLRRSNWFNALSARLTEHQIDLLLELPFVATIQPVLHFAAPQHLAIDCDSLQVNYGPQHQLDMMGMQELHEMGYQGQGITIAVFDNGFRRIDSLPAFRHLFDEQRIIATKDFVDGDDEVYLPCEKGSHCRHGTSVLSVLAANDPEGLIGSAPKANYILLRTEDDRSETRVEEDNWVEAAEFAYSLGARVFSTSLGYLTFDDGVGDYRTQDLDGKTTLITQAAEIAAARGVLVVNSAGNGGEQGIVAPADGANVLAIGAVDACENIASFSSHGPSADGRTKPDIVAMGQGIYVVNTSGNLVKGNGTSFSAPLISGMLACLVQAMPQADKESVYQAVLQSANRFDTPDFLYGHGLPSAPEALKTLRNLYSLQDQVVIFPNPSKEFFFLRMDVPTPQALLVEIYTSHGQPIFSKEIAPQSNFQEKIDHKLARGIYFVHIKVSDGTSIYGKKLVVL